MPCGYIHRGPVQRPPGGGHWLIVYGHTPIHVVVNDQAARRCLLALASWEQQGQIDVQRIGRIGPLITGEAVAEHHPGWQGSDLLEEVRCAGSDLTLLSQSQWSRAGP